MTESVATTILVMALSLGGGSAAKHAFLTWAPVPGAVAYELQVSEGPGFSALAFTTSVQSIAYRWRVTENRLYYWRVRGLDAQGRPGLWSKISTIEPEAPPSVTPEVKPKPKPRPKPKPKPKLKPKPKPRPEPKAEPELEPKPEPPVVTAEPPAVDPPPTAPPAEIESETPPPTPGRPAEATASPIPEMPADPPAQTSPPTPAEVISAQPDEAAPETPPPEEPAQIEDEIDHAPAQEPDSWWIGARVGVGGDLRLWSPFVAADLVWAPGLFDGALLVSARIGYHQYEGVFELPGTQLQLSHCGRLVTSTVAAAYRLGLGPLELTGGAGPSLQLTFVQVDASARFGARAGAELFFAAGYQLGPGVLGIDLALFLHGSDEPLLELPPVSLMLTAGYRIGW